MDVARELGWDDEISQESTFTLLDEGDYRFRIEKFERGRHNGSTKLPACNKAILTLSILDEDGNKLSDLTHNLFLHSSVEGLLSSFFLAIGQKKHGEPLRMNWGAVTGSSGWCHIFVDTYTKNDGSEGKSNKIKYFIDPEKAPAGATASAPVQQPPQQPPQQTSFSGWGAGGGNNWTNR